MQFASRLFSAALSFCILSGSAIAQDEKQSPIAFEGGNFTIDETSDGDKTLSFDGQLLARNYVVFFDRFIELSDGKVALFAIGDGGNQCGTATLIAWRPGEGSIESDYIGEDDCGTPPAAATGDTIYFVPYLLPGASAPVRSWTIRDHLRISGNLAFAPQPGTSWGELDAFETIGSMIDTLSNEAVYKEATKLLGSSLNQVMTGLVVGGGPEALPSGAFFASGCVPHACGSADAFMAIDPKAKKLYFAQQQDGSTVKFWPARNVWPVDIAAAMKQALAPQ